MLYQTADSAESCMQSRRLKLHDRLSLPSRYCIAPIRVHHHETAVKVWIEEGGTPDENLHHLHMPDNDSCIRIMEAATADT